MSTTSPPLLRGSLQSPVKLPVKRASKLNDSVFVKYGTSDEIQREVDALEFVQRHTSIPVPSVIESHIQERGSWFSMKLIPGNSLTNMWTSMSQEAQATTTKDLHDRIEELRALRPPEPACIGSCTDGPAYDHRLNNGSPCGPFASVSDFHNFLVAPVARCPRQELVSHYREQLADDHALVFSHADLCGDHIFVEPVTGEITGIIDWEMAGWWPAYWEYTKSLYGNKYEPWWIELVPKVLRPYQHELRIEDDLQQF